jgi:ribosomal protein L19
MFSTLAKTKITKFNSAKNFLNYNNFYETTFRTYLGITGKRRESVFNQNKFNEYYLESRKQHKAKRNPITQAKFEDDDYKWETIPSAVKENGKQLIEILRKEELEKLKKNSPNREPIRLGDKIDVEYYHSITSKKLYKYTGVVVGIKRQNSHNFSFKFLTVVAESYMLLDYLYYSPMIASIKVVLPSSLDKNVKRKKIYNLRHIKDFGQYLVEILKGGKRTNLSKKAKQEIRKIESEKENIILE